MGGLRQNTALIFGRGEVGSHHSCRVAPLLQKEESPGALECLSDVGRDNCPAQESLDQPPGDRFVHDLRAPASRIPRGLVE